MSAAPLKLLIVDDEAPARERLERLLAEIPNWQVAGSCGTGAEALNMAQQLAPAAVLLDIRMPGMSGIEAARHLATMPAPPAVVFTTAYDDYAIEAFDAQAIGYLLKPVRRERLEKALAQAARLGAAQLRSLATDASPDEPRRHIATRLGEQIRLIPVADIALFRADQKYVSVVHGGGEELIDEALRDLAAEFADGSAAATNRCQSAGGRWQSSNAICACAASGTPPGSVAERMRSRNQRELRSRSSAVMDASPVDLGSMCDACGTKTLSPAMMHDR
jgi:two-component system response regulator AlgR